MDPLSISAALLSILALAQNVAKLTSAVTRLHDPKVDQIYYRLLAEKKRTEGWASHMRVLNSTDLRAIIPPGEFDEVAVLVKKLDYYYKLAQQKFSVIERSKGGPIDRAFLIARTKFLIGGYEDLKEFVDTLAAMNEALKSIAPPLPTYSPGPYRDRSPLRASPAITMDDDVTPAAESSPASEAEETAQHDGEANSVDGPTTTQSVQSIYQASLENLVVLSVRRHHPHIARSASRLKIWGAGLFMMSIPLDVVFESDKDGCRLLRSCILKILVEILVWEEQELNILAGEAINEERFHDQHRAQATTALLGSDALMGFALESWKNLLERQAGDQTSPTVSRTGGDLIPDLVQILFDLLPALRAARQTYCVRLAEASTQSKTTAEGQMDVSTAGVVPSRDSVESKLDAVGKILNKRDQLATKKGKNVRLYSPIFRKERERLREFYTSQTSQSSTTNRNTKQLEWKQTELAATLSEYLEQSAKKSDTQLLEDRKTWRPAFARARSEKSRDKDKEIPTLQEEGRIDEVIGFLRNSTSDMWSIAGAR